MIPRTLSKHIEEAFKKFPIIALTGPRQTGKTTLIKKLFKDRLQYVNLEDLEIRSFAQQDPKGFLATYDKGAILDEVQNVPDLFSYIQVMVDESNTNGQFILIGSQNFLLHEKISQTLAGRVAIFHLLPLNIDEFVQAGMASLDLEQFLYMGCYPRIYEQQIDPYQWYSGYINTYVEKDLRMIKNIHDLGVFQTFLKMCAARTGQILDLTSIGNDCGISHNTVRSWIQILQSSFIIFLLQPHYRNFNKRLVKSPKIYFYDSGLLCHLLGIETAKQLQSHYLRGGIFESFILSNLMKTRYNQAKEPHLYFWRDKYGKEIDCIAELGDTCIPIEIKSAKTINSDFFDNLLYWNTLSGISPDKNVLIYAGELNQKRSKGHVLPWIEGNNVFTNF